MATIQPFANAGGHTTFDNAILDHIMPRCKPNTWKIICATLRKTIGWADADSPTGRKQSDQISMSQYHKLTGISSRQTLVTAIEDCLENGYLIRQKLGKSYSYSLNRRYDFRTDTGTEIVPIIGTEIVHTKETNKQTPKETTTSADKPRSDSQHPAIQAYRLKAKTYPDKAQFDTIIQAVGESDDSLAFWGDVVKAYIDLGWNKRNIGNMVSYFQRHELPRLNGKSNSNGRGAVDWQAALRESVEKHNGNV